MPTTVQCFVDLTQYARRTSGDHKIPGNLGRPSPNDDGDSGDGNPGGDIDSEPGEQRFSGSEGGTLDIPNLPRLSLGIATLSRVTADDPRIADKDCIICQNSLRLADAIVRLRCSHAFCEVCICRSLVNDRSCPSCRGPVFVKDQNLHKREARRYEIVSRRFRILLHEEASCRQEQEATMRRERECASRIARHEENLTNLRSRRGESQRARRANEVRLGEIAQGMRRLKEEKTALQRDAGGLLTAANGLRREIDAEERKLRTVVRSQRQLAGQKVRTEEQTKRLCAKRQRLARLLVL